MKIYRKIALICAIALVLNTLIFSSEVQAIPTQPTYYFYDIYSTYEVYIDNSPWEYVGEESKYLGFSEKNGQETEYKAYLGTSYSFLKDENKYSVYHDTFRKYYYTFTLNREYYYTGNLNIDKSSIGINNKVYKFIPKEKNEVYEYGGKVYNNYIEYTGDLYVKETYRNTSEIKKVIFKNDVILDGSYPVDGFHRDGYWYVRKEKLDLEGFGEINIENLSPELRKDIMPLINVVVNKNFDEVVQGRGYMGNYVTARIPDGEVTITRQNDKYIRVKGKFTAKGVKFIDTVNSQGKSAYFLFNVMDEPNMTSLTGITFVNNKPQAEFIIANKGATITDNFITPLTIEGPIEVELVDKSASNYNIVSWEWSIWDGQEWKVISRQNNFKYTVKDPLTNFRLKVTDSQGNESNYVTHNVYLNINK